MGTLANNKSDKYIKVAEMSEAVPGRDYATV